MRADKSGGVSFINRRLRLICLGQLILCSHFALTFFFLLLFLGYFFLTLLERVIWFGHLRSDESVPVEADRNSRSISLIIFFYTIIAINNSE